MSKLPTSRLPVTPSKVATAPKSGLRPPQQTSTVSTSSQQVSPTGGDSSTNPLVIGDRVTANGKSGTVAFIGPTKFAEGEWMGIILDDAQGKNDGSFDGTRYFQTESNRGLFCRPAKVERLVQNGANSGDDTSGSAKAQITPLADSSKLSTSTSNLKDDGDTTLVSTTTTDTSNTITNNQTASAEASSSQELLVGDRVVVSGTKYGTLKYLGKIHVAEGIWCGIQLDEPLGKNDGSVSGKRYFTCQQRYGLFSPVTRVEKVTNELTQSQLIARKASISSSTNNNLQLHRSTSQESLHSNLSEFSASSNSISRIPMKTPSKSQQQKLATNTNLYTTPNTKTLLTQAAATLAAATPTSNQLSNLVQTIKDRDIYIEKLQQQREQDRLEFSRAAQQVDEMENRMLAFKKQYDVKELENEQLKKDEYQTKQRLEDLEFQLEEYKLTDANKEHSTIPDGSRVLSPKDIEIYEHIKEKVVDLESINQKLILEKQTLYDEHRQELKRQNESHENDYKTRLSELEKKYHSDLNVRQTNNTETIKSEYETKLNEKDKQTNDLIEQIKNQKQQEIDQLKSQINDLQNKEQSKTASLSEKENFYEQQLKEQQSKIEQSIKETQEIQSQLTTLRHENETTEKRANDIRIELQRHQEDIVPELEKQCQTLKSDLAELQNRDRTANMALGERESHFEQQMKEYQTNIDQAVLETEKVRNELKQIHEENLSKEKEINQIKQDYEKRCEHLQSELNDREHKASSTFSERETQHEQQIKEYENSLNQSTNEIQTIQSELTKLQEEKISNEKKLNDTINTSKQDYERQYEILKNELTELQDRDRSQNMALNDRETHYETQIKEYQAKRDQAVRETQDLRTELNKLQDEKVSNEKHLNNNIDTLKQDFEKQIESFKNQLAEAENQNRTKTNEFSEKEQQIKEYQSKLDQLTEEKTELHQQFEHKQRESETKLNQLQNELDEKHQTNEEINDVKQKYEQTQNEFIKQIENLTNECERSSANNETHKKDFQDLQNKYTDLQNEYQKHLTSNEQLKNTNDNIVNEKQALIDQLTKQLNDTQQVHGELIEKQIKQHNDSEQQRLEDKKIHEKIVKEKTDEYETKIQMMKSEFLLETENSNLDHEQEKLRLKSQLQQAHQGGDNKHTSSSNTSIKQLQYELTEARYQIEKLQKQVEANATRDDRSTLEGQINFLNDVIVDLRNTNERLKKDMEFQKNPFVGDEEFSQNSTTRVRSSAPRLYCDMCEIFDQHDTDDCPKQSSLIDDQPEAHNHPRDKVIPPARLYCEKCEEFGHDCNEVDETY